MTELELQIALASLTEKVSGGFANVDRVMAYQNTELAEIKSEVKRTNGRVTQLETVNAARTAGDVATAKAVERASNQSPIVTWETVKTFGQFSGWIVAGGIGLLKLIGKL